MDTVANPRSSVADPQSNDGIQSLSRYIGNTPLIRLKRIRNSGELRIFAKAEFMNLGGSVKSRTALWMLRDAIQSGRLRPGMTIVEATTGNEGIALAMLAAAGGYKVRIVMPEFVPVERRHIIALYGGRVDLVPSRKTIHETITECARVAEELANDESVFYARQFENIANPAAHEESTGPEIIQQIDGPIDAIVAAIGTGGTLLGVSRAVRRTFPDVKVFAVEPTEAAVLSGGINCMHRQFGIGEGFVPAVFDRRIANEVVTISDDEAYEMTREIARTEGLAVGISSGTNVAAALKVAKGLPKGASIVTVLSDSAERYLTMLAHA